MKIEKQFPDLPVETGGYYAPKIRQVVLGVTQSLMIISNNQSIEDIPTEDW